MRKRNTKRTPKQNRARAIPLVGVAGLSLSLAGTASVIGDEPAAAMPTPMVGGIELLGEEEISDVSLATFYVFEKEDPSSSDLQLVRGGCHGCHGCGHGGCHHAGGCHGCHGCGGCHHGCGCHGCHGCGGCGGCGCASIWWGGCGGCGGCGGHWCWWHGHRHWCRWHY